MQFNKEFLQHQPKRIGIRIISNDTKPNELTLNISNVRDRGISKNPFYGNFKHIYH